MKRLIALFLVAISCFTLVACGTDHKTQEQQSVQMQQDVCSITMKINPLFEIFVDNDFIIIDIKYLNSDAKEALSDINILSSSFEDGVTELLDALYAKGYVKNNELQITYAVQTGNSTEIDDSQIINGLETAINDFSDSKNISVTANMVASDDIFIQPEQKVVTNGDFIVDDWELLDEFTVERDTNGNIIRYIETDDAGNQFIYNAQKQLIQERILTENGFVETNYDGNGNIIGNVIQDDMIDEWEQMDNITAERDADGNVIRYIETDSNGSKFIYNANKQKVYALINSETGCSEKYYDENGLVTKHIFTGNDGSRTEYFYHESGDQKQIYTVFANGEFKDEYYDATGNRIKYIERRNVSDGAYLVEYDTDGNGNTDYQYFYAADGTVWYNEFDANGNQILENQKQIQ